MADGHGNRIPLRQPRPLLLTPRLALATSDRRSQHDVSRFYLPRLAGRFLQRLEADREGLSARRNGPTAAVAGGTRPHGRMEEMSPTNSNKSCGNADRVRARGDLRHTAGICRLFRRIKAMVVRTCCRADRRNRTADVFLWTGGVMWVQMDADASEAQITPLIEATLDHLARQGFQVVVS